MAADINIEEWNGGAPGTQTDKTAGTIRFRNTDSATVDLNNPLIIPTTGREYSFEKWLRLRDMGDFYTQIDNIVAYSDGENSITVGSPSEVLVHYAVTGTYDEPRVPDESFTIPQSPAAGSPQENMADFFTSSSSSTIDMDAINTGPFTPGSPSEAIGDWLVLVMEVRPGATQGITPSETLTFAFDEI